MLRCGFRRGDHAPLAMIEYVDNPLPPLRAGKVREPKAPDAKYRASSKTLSEEDMGAISLCIAVLILADSRFCSCVEQAHGGAGTTPQACQRPLLAQYYTSPTHVSVRLYEVWLVWSHVLD